MPIKSDVYEIGMMRQLLADDYMKRIEKIIDDYQDKMKKYFIMVHSDMDATTGKIQTKFLIMNDLPPKMLGTIVYLVDNTKGQLRKLWALPRDIPRSEEFIDHDSAMSPELSVQKIDGNDMPVIY